MKTSACFVRSLLGLALLTVIAGCGGGGAAAPAIPALPISVSVSASASTVEAGGTVMVTATVSNDSSGKGVTWTISPTSGAGTLIGATSTSVTYEAPASPPTSDVGVTITATSETDTSKSGFASITLLAITVSVAQTTGTPGIVQAGTAAQFTATVSNDPSNKGVTWSVSCPTAPCGKVSPASTPSGTSTTYTAPSTPPASNLSVTITAISVTDATKSAPASITVPALLAITTTSLQQGTADTAYSQTLQATGGVPPYTWSVVAGSLPQFLGLNSGSGKISGVTVQAGTSNFTVQVADSETPAMTAKEALSIAVTTVLSPNNSELNGHYAFLFEGFDDATGSRVAVAGSFTADGAGKIASGVEDINGPGGPSEEVPFTGTYSIQTDNRGFFTIDTASGIKAYAFVVGSIVSGLAQKASFIEFDDTTGTNGHRGSGILRLQDTTAFAIASITGPYAFGIVGQDASKNRKGIVGTFTTNGAGTITGGIADQSVAGTVTNSIPLTGIYTAPSTANGRATVTLNLSGGSLDQSAYVVSAKELLVISTDTFSTDGLTSGTDLSQASTSFSNSSLNAPAVFYDVGVCAASPTTESSNDEIGLASGNGSGTLKVTNDDNNCGATVASGSTFTATYAAAANGRVTIKGWNGDSTSPQRIFYLVDTNKGFFLDTSASAGFGFFEPQSAGPFSNASLSGTFPANTVAPAASPDPNGSGVAVLDGVGAFRTTEDLSSTSGLIVDEVTSGSYSVTANGRGTVTGLTTSSSAVAFLVVFGSLSLLLKFLRRPRPALRLALARLLLVAAITLALSSCIAPPTLVFYIISPTKAVMIQEGRGNNAPTVTVIGQ